MARLGARQSRACRPAGPQCDGTTQPGDGAYVHRQSLERRQDRQVVLDPSADGRAHRAPAPPVRRREVPPRQLVTTQLVTAGQAARKAALAILSDVLRKRRPLDAALEHASRLEPRDAGFARAIASETLRRFGQLDA